jgi:hypothetical protein
LRLLKVMNAVHHKNQTGGVAPPWIRKVVAGQLKRLPMKQTAAAISLGYPIHATVCWITFHAP